MDRNMNLPPGKDAMIMSIDGESNNINGDNGATGGSGEASSPLLTDPIITSQTFSATRPSAPTFTGTGFPDFSARRNYGSANTAAPFVMMSAITPRVFTGLESEDAREWLDHYELICKSNGWDNSLIMNRVITALAGHALSWYMSYIKENGTQQWPTFKDDFLGAFGVKRPGLFHLTKLMARERLPNESIRHYIMEMRKLKEQCSGGVSDDQLMGMILKGMHDKKLATSLYCKTYEDFDDFFATVMLRVEGNQFYEDTVASDVKVFAMEPAQKMLIPRSNRHDEEKSDNRPPKASSACFYCNTTGHFIHECRQMKRDRSFWPTAATAGLSTATVCAALLPAAVSATTIPTTTIPATIVLFGAQPLSITAAAKFLLPGA